MSKAKKFMNKLANILMDSKTNGPNLDLLRDSYIIISDLLRENDRLVRNYREVLIDKDCLSLTIDNDRKTIKEVVTKYETKKFYMDYYDQHKELPSIKNLIEDIKSMEVIKN